jgi:serine/threonine protein kinase
MKACPKCGIEYPDTITLCPADGNALEKTGDALLGKTLAGKYRIDVRISEGGMGTVYRGTHVLMDKTVAIKVLHPSLAADEKIVARFSREARAASKILHPHAISVTDFGEDEGGSVFLVMEYLSGRTLKEIVRQDGPMALPRVVEIIRQVGDALDEAHGQGVVHRDLKSDNIMLISTAGTDYAKVLDFGIAKIKEPDDGYDPGLTSPDLVIGTPQYMSPEQCSQSPDIDARSDIYSLGIIIYEMLVGHVPFTGESPTAIMLKHLQHASPSVLDERTDVPAAVDKVISRAMQKRPEERYNTVGELVEDLTIASGMELRTPSSEYPKPTMTNASAVQVDDVDEETLVRRRHTTPMTPPPAPPDEMPPPVSQYDMPPPASGFNPWKVLVPSIVGLVVIFGAIFAFTRNSQPATPESPSASPLTADPNSLPVEAASPATGQSEVGIPSGGATDPTPSPTDTPSPSPTDDPGQVPNPTLSPTERPPLPSPTRSVEEPPQPTPQGSRPAASKPTLPPPVASPSIVL